MLQQTHQDLELIIVDDCSTDGSRQIAQSFNHDSRVRVITLSDNQGVAVARNVGIEQATGSIIAVLDADDLFHKNNLKERVEILERFPQSVIYSQVCIVDDQGKRIGDGIPVLPEGDVGKDLLSFYFLRCGSNLLVSRERLLDMIRDAQRND